TSVLPLSVVLSGSAIAAPQPSFTGTATYEDASVYAPGTPLSDKRILTVWAGARSTDNAEAGPPQGLPAASSLHASSVNAPHAPLYTESTVSIAEPQVLSES